MGGVVRRVRKAVRKATRFVDKKIVEPLERPVKKVAKGVKNVADEAFEELIEKPVKKVGKETFDTVMGITDEERRMILYGETPEVPEVTPEVTPEVVPDDETLLERGRRRTRSTKRSGGAGTLMEGYGVPFRKPNPKAPTGSG